MAVSATICEHDSTPLIHPARPCCSCGHRLHLPWSPEPRYFKINCASCHPNGENIIRRGRTLKIKALTKRGIDSSEAIAQVAREGIGQMSGYADALGEGGDVIVAEWVWQQAQNAWIQG